MRRRESTSPGNGLGEDAQKDRYRSVMRINPVKLSKIRELLQATK